MASEVLDNMFDTHSLSDSQHSCDDAVSVHTDNGFDMAMSSIEPTAGPSTSSRRLTLNDIHIPAGFEIAQGLGENGTEYPSEEKIQKAVEVLNSLRGKLPSAADGQVAACDYCRRRKIKCDRVKPTCGSCVQSGKTCTTEDVLRKRGPPSKREKAVLEAAGIIFRGTRPHRRRRTTITSVSTPSARTLSNDRINAKIEKASRARSYSTNSKSLSLKPEAWASKGGSWWLEMLSAASETPYPFQDSPEHSPSASSSVDQQGMDAGACDYLPDPYVNMVPSEHSTHTAQWENMWATFGNALRQKHAAEDAAARMAGMLDVTNTAAAFPTLDKSLDAAALDWSSGTPSFEVQQSQLVPPTYQPPSLITFPDASLQPLATSMPWSNIMSDLIDSSTSGSASDSNNSSLLASPTPAMMTAGVPQPLGNPIPGTVSL